MLLRHIWNEKDSSRAVRYWCSDIYMIWLWGQITQYNWSLFSIHVDYFIIIFYDYLANKDYYSYIAFFYSTNSKS